MYFLANLAITDVFQPLQLPTSCSATMSIQSSKGVAEHTRLSGPEGSRSEERRQLERREPRSVVDAEPPRSLIKRRLKTSSSLGLRNSNSLPYACIESVIIT